MKPVAKFSRRDLLRAGGTASLTAAVAVGGGLAMPAGALAKAPMQDSQMPGFFRFFLGAFEITVVSDGNLVVPAGRFADNIPEVTFKAFLRSHAQSTSQRVLQLNTVLINTGAELILIDAGAGDNFQASGGRLAANLEAAGYKADQVDRVIITHAHPDHIWGLIDDFEGGPRFPKASYVITSAEWDFWTDAETVKTIRKDLRGFAVGARKHLLPLASKMKRVNPDAQIAPGIKLLDTSGHTPGHVSVMVEQGGERLLVTADVVLTPYVSFEQPDWQPNSDLDKKQAVKRRKALLKMAAGERLKMLCYHLPFPGIGYAVTSGQAYRWIPASLQWNAKG